MTVVRLSDGSLWVDSPVPVSFDTVKAIAALGPVRHLVAATPRHVWRVDGWHTLFPDARLWTARKTILTLKKRNMPPAAVLGNSPAKEWQDDLDQLGFKGNPLAEEIIFLHRTSGTVILDDLIQVHELRPGRPLLNALARFAGVAAPRGGVGLDIRMTFFDRSAARMSLERLLSWDFDRLIIAHGPCIEIGAKPVVERAFRWLKG